MTAPENRARLSEIERLTEKGYLRGAFTDETCWLITQLEASWKREEIAREHFEGLVEACEWYFDKGTEHELKHFLKVEARGNYLEQAIEKMEAVE